MPDFASPYFHGRGRKSSPFHRCFIGQARQAMEFLSSLLVALALRRFEQLCHAEPAGELDDQNLLLERCEGVLKRPEGRQIDNVAVPAQAGQRAGKHDCIPNGAGRA